LRTLKKRWGEVRILRQGEKKNDFDKSKSFSIINNPYHYSLFEVKDILAELIDLTENYDYRSLKKILKDLNSKEAENGKK